ncbi:hypothetical protein [Halomonas saccharevitans]|uniref:Uncharacterized protein n=1 Tax=Halomonas saccharevitans TaxID=416872 RepID=A0A1I6ZZW5_9GAMM|nr:hypothetical protein [Halomonas saccharevitans]SFT68213.1 hypothetical protein SAMN04487956_11454 [Halomonas saccharevitans]
MHKPRYRDKVLIEKADGQQLGPVQATVDKGIIFAAPTHLIEVGDILLREMPQGGHERYVVDEPGFKQGSGKLIPSHFQAEVHREDARRTSESVSTPDHQIPPTPPGSVTINFNGDHGRVYQHSNDNSQTVINAIEPQLEALRTELRDKVEDPQRLADLEHEIDALKASRPDPSTIGEQLDSLMRKGADYAEIIGKYKSGIMAVAAALA